MGCSGGWREAEEEKGEIGDEKGRRCKKIRLWRRAVLYDGRRAPGKRSADGEGDTGVVFWTDIFSALSKCSLATRQFFRNDTTAVLCHFTGP